ncbi:hypothetical protein [Pseudoxanthomonas sp. SGT-18]|nr:hypothetical protein [Pseudoxanthomonas sp. SGT-18]
MCSSTAAPPDGSTSAAIQRVSRSEVSELETVHSTMKAIAPM